MVALQQALSRASIGTSQSSRQIVGVLGSLFHHHLALVVCLVEALAIQMGCGSAALTRDKLRYPRDTSNSSHSSPAIVTWLDESYTSFANDGEISRKPLEGAADVIQSIVSRS